MAAEPSKIILGNETILDISQDTVNSSNLLQGETAHGSDGNRVVGSLVVTPIEDAQVTFTEAETRTNIASGETVATLFGKIKKFFTDLKTVAFTGSYGDLSNKPTLGTASEKDIATTGDASSTQVVMGNDSRLSDEKVKINKIDDINWHRVTLASNTNTSETINLEKSPGLQFVNTPIGTTEADGIAYLALGNINSSGTDDNYRGILRIYAKNDKRVDISLGGATPSANTDIVLPANKSGTIALQENNYILSPGESKTLVIPFASSGFICFYGASNDMIGIGMIHAWSNGRTFKWIGTQPSQIATSSSNNGVVITNNNNSNTLYLYYHSLKGDIPTFS